MQGESISFFIHQISDIWGRSFRRDWAMACPNVMLTGSAVSYLAIIRAINLLGPSRVCFGSDAPFALPYVERAAYEAFLPEVTDKNGYECVMCKNAARFFQCPTSC